MTTRGRTSTKGITAQLRLLDEYGHEIVRLPDVLVVTNGWQALLSADVEQEVGGSPGALATLAELSIGGAIYRALIRPPLYLGAKPVPVRIGCDHTNFSKV